MPTASSQPVRVPLPQPLPAPAADTCSPYTRARTVTKRLLLAVFVLGPLPACAGSPLALLYRFFTRDLCDLARAAARRAGGERGEAALLSGAAAARRWAPLGVQLVYLALVAIGYHVFVDRVLDDLRDQVRACVRACGRAGGRCLRSCGVGGI